jgi:hypothetical protein
MSSTESAPTASANAWQTCVVTRHATPFCALHRIGAWCVQGRTHQHTTAYRRFARPRASEHTDDPDRRVHAPSVAHCSTRAAGARAPAEADPRPHDWPLSWGAGRQQHACAPPRKETDARVRAEGGAAHAVGQGQPDRPPPHRLASPAARSLAKPAEHKDVVARGGGDGSCVPELRSVVLGLAAGSRRRLAPTNDAGAPPPAGAERCPR